MNLIKRIDDSTSIEMGRGKFDDYCVFINTDGKRTAPKDIDYFDYLITLMTFYSTDQIYDDFVHVYDLTTKFIDENVLNLIEDNAQRYRDSFEYTKWMTILYLAMVAEENKAYTVLGKKIKRLGIHQILFKNYSSIQAAQFSKGLKAKEIIDICAHYGF